MNFPPAQAETGRDNTAGQAWVWALAALAVCLAAITSESLWIDEAFMAAKAGQPTLHGWWQAMIAGKGSDLQMPLYMIYVWGFAKIFGLSEWALRAANIPWFVAGVTVFIPAFPKAQRPVVAAVTLLCPFAWFYLDEARPYAMQLGVSLVIFAALYRLSQESMSLASERKWVAALLAALVGLCGSSLLGVIWAGAVILCAPFLFSRRRLGEWARAHWLAGLITGGLLALLAVYYVWTLKMGARASDAGKTDMRTMIFIVYELLGFSGLGPSRLEIRSGGLSVFDQYSVPLTVYAVLLTGVVLPGVVFIAADSSRRTLAGLAVGIAVPAGGLLAAGVALHFRVLGRHFTPLMPALCFGLSVGLVAGWSSAFWISKACAKGFVILSLMSCLLLRLQAHREKDDYRDAAHVAQAGLNSGLKVWWNAASDGAIYYQLPLATEPDQAKGAFLVLNPTSRLLAGLAAPDLVITSKPDLYDNQEALVNYLRNNPYTRISTFPAFAVWERKTGPVKH